MKPAKTELRKKLKRARLALMPEQRSAKSTAIVVRLWQAVDWSGVGSLYVYEPIERLGEVDITDFITALQTEYPEVQLFTSRQVNSNWHLVSLKDGKAAETIQPDVIIVPMLGFDPVSLHRIGYGGGYYDRFLASLPQARKIGVCFELGKVPAIPVEPHDISLDMIITEAAVYTKQ